MVRVIRWDSISTFDDSQNKCPCTGTISQMQCIGGVTVHFEIFGDSMITNELAPTNFDQTQSAQVAWLVLKYERVVKLRTDHCECME